MNLPSRTLIFVLEALHGGSSSSEDEGDICVDDLRIVEGECGTYMYIVHDYNRQFIKPFIHLHVHVCAWIRGLSGFHDCFFRFAFQSPLDLSHLPSSRRSMSCLGSVRSGKLWRRPSHSCVCSLVSRATTRGSCTRETRPPLSLARQNIPGMLIVRIEAL